MWCDTFAGSTRALPSDVQPTERLSTFVFRPDQVVKKANSIHYSRLMPRRRDKMPGGRLETSVCRSQNLTEAKIWAICSAFFDKRAPRPAIGRGDGPAEAVIAVGLRFDADGKPYPQHANIIGWRDSVDTPDSELKHFWMDQAQRMAPRFLYVPRP
jgi:hypothetical protein